MPRQLYNESRLLLSAPLPEIGPAVADSEAAIVNPALLTCVNVTYDTYNWYRISERLAVRYLWSASLSCYVSCWKLRCQAIKTGCVVPARGSCCLDVLFALN